MTDNPKNIIIVGGGAAGFFAAIQAKTLCPSARVTLFEAANKCLGKVKISGGGRCNVTHACFSVSDLVQHYPRGQKELRGVFSRFGPQDTINWFAAHGVTLKTEPDRRMFPVSNQSQTIIDCLIQAARQAGVSINTRCPVTAIHYTPQASHRFQLETALGSVTADAVLLATGSAKVGWQWAQALGHTLVPPVPSLFTVTINNPTLSALAGVSMPLVQAGISVLGLKKSLVQTGPLLITHQGLSGPAILKLSAWGARVLAEAHYQGTLLLDFAPDTLNETLLEQLETLKKTAPKKQVGNESVVQAMPKRLWQWVIQNGCSQSIPIDTPFASLSQKQLQAIVNGIKCQRLSIAGMNRYKDEFVTAGGVMLKEVDMRTLESKIVPGLYFAGEILDIDAVTGGFNFQNAWSTGWIAGEQMANMAAC